ncbi:uncharacterized protein LOC103312710 [Tribolium castaneum]|nr:PREDICTED: myrosinase-binding protein 2 [Tribolium castaneum]|eukprot:XP_008192309.1 PREDICTED: myrosinase-binding protein 2 [Tribolium castaneum]
MKPFAVILAFCCLAHARPGFEHHGGHHLEGVPNESHYGKLHYPKFDIIHLGSAIKDTLPPAVVEITKKVVIKEPHPYPVKVPVPVPHPIEVPKPYPVVHTKLVKVPHPVPVEIIKKVPVAFEVPKPFPVPVEEFKGHQGGSEGSFGGSFGGHEQFGHQQLNEVHEEGQEGGGFEGGFHGGDNAGGFSEQDQSGAYGTQVNAQAQQVGWVPLQMAGEQQAQEQHQGS